MHRIQSCEQDTSPRFRNIRLPSPLIDSTHLGEEKSKYPDLCTYHRSGGTDLQRRWIRYTSGRYNLRKDSNWWQRVVGVGAAGYTVIKMKGISVLLPILKVAKIGPLLSMGASMAAYGWLFGWKFGVGMVALIFVHELGHGLVMRALGVPVGPMTFIPFFGAVIEMKGRPMNSYHDALIALGGPVLGTVATLPVLAFGAMTGSQFALALSHWGCMVNLFNLLPIGMLDGGRIAGALSKWTLPAGFALACTGIWTFPHNPIMYLTALSACFSTYSRFFGSESMESDFWKMAADKQILIGGAYVSLAALLAGCMQFNDSLRKSPDQIRREIVLESEWGETEDLFSWSDEKSWFSDSSSHNRDGWV
jgi:Zn-dependent protease